MRIYVPIALLSTVLGACNSTRSVRASPVSRTFSGTCELTFSAPPLPPPPVFLQTDFGTCHFTELGETRFYGVQQINPAAGTQSGERTFTTANGDILHLVHTGTSTPSGPGLVSFRATAKIDGGTGSFANATGSVLGSGVANLATHTTTVTFEGTITSAGSDQSRK